MRFLDNPPHTFSVSAPRVDRDSEGGSVITYVLVASSVGGLVRGASSDDQKLFEQMQICATHVISSKFADVVSNGDRINYNGKPYHVTGKRKQDSVGMSIPTFYEIYMDEKVPR